MANLMGLTFILAEFYEFKLFSPFQKYKLLTEPNLCKRIIKKATNIRL